MRVPAGRAYTETWHIPGTYRVRAGAYGGLVGRDPRIQTADAIHHVYSRGNRREVIYRVDYDFHRFLLYLCDELVKRDWRCLAYALIPNHYHLVIETPEANLSAGMHRLNLRWAKAFNREYRQYGHVFQSRFGSRVVTDELDFNNVLRYVLRNPVNAGLGSDAREWPWSSYSEIAGAAEPRWLVNVERLGELLRCSVAEIPARLATLLA
jgi:putative transposase